MTVLLVYSKLCIIRIQWDLKNNSEYAEKNALVLVNLTRKFVRITREFGFYCIHIVYITISAIYVLYFILLYPF